jgi:hypothetical protein
LATPSTKSGSSCKQRPDNLDLSGVALGVRLMRGQVVSRLLIAAIIVGRSAVEELVGSAAPP